MPDSTCPNARRSPRDRSLALAPFVFAIVFLLLGGPGAAARADWALQSATPTDRHLYGVSFVDPLHGFLVGINRHLLETTDGGATWATRMSSGFGTDPFNAVTFADPMHAYVTGNNNDAWRTTDGGATWSQMTSVPAGSWSHLDFIDGVTARAASISRRASTSHASSSRRPTRPQARSARRLTGACSCVSGLRR